MSEFFHMGGYAAYVWPALGLSALVLAVLYIHSHHTLAAREAELAALTSDSDHEAEA